MFELYDINEGSMLSSGMFDAFTSARADTEEGLQNQNTVAIFKGVFRIVDLKKDFQEEGLTGPLF